MPISPKLGAEAAAANLADLQPALSPQEAVVEANRCLFCFDAPCIQACPTGIDVPSFIRKISSGNLAGSARTILSANILGASCARVCPTSELCEGACVVLDLEGDPVKIGRLQRHATDYAARRGLMPLKNAAVSTGKRVAVIGGGPAGLSCAAELAQLGHKAVVYEKKAAAGGLNTYGVALYKMTPEVSLAEVELVKSLGVEIHCGVEVGRDVSFAQLQREFDAVFVGIGLAAGRPLRIPGEDLPEVVEAIHFIEQIHTLPPHQAPVGDHVIVIGGGNTAIDALTQARRLGAGAVTGVYRRGEADMPAYDFEYELAKRDGARFLFHVRPLEVLADASGHVSGLRMARVATNPRGEVEVIAGSEFVEPCDMVIKAVGQRKQAALLRQWAPGLELDARGTVKYDLTTGQTSLPFVFAGGDCANGGREVVNAVADGKRAARGIHVRLGGQPVRGPLQPSRLGVEGAPMGSGFDHPLRLRELEAEQAKNEESHGRPVH